MIMRHYQFYAIVFLYMSLTSQIQGDGVRDIIYFVLAIATYYGGVWLERKNEKTTNI